VLAIWITLTGGAVCLAQQQVDAQVDNRMNGELYGGGTGSGMRYAMPQSELLPSEVRNAAWCSGALPSDIRLNRLSIGPLAPWGSINYIPRQSPLQEAMRLPPPQLYNRAYNIPEPRPSSKPIAGALIDGRLPDLTLRDQWRGPSAPEEGLAPGQVSGQAPWARPLPSALPLPPIIPPGAQPAELNRPPEKAPDAAPSDALAPSESFYLSHLTLGSSRPTAPTTRPQGQGQAQAQPQR
jgi:hypothetical protein